MNWHKCSKGRREYYTSIDHFDDSNRNTIHQPYGKNASDWTFDGVVICELPRKGGLPAEQVSCARISHSKLHEIAALPTTTSGP